MTRHHLTDTELLAQHFDRRGGGVHEHLALCATCQERGRAITELLDDVSQATASLILMEARGTAAMSWGVVILGLLAMTSST